MGNSEARWAWLNTMRAPLSPLALHNSMKSSPSTSSMLVGITIKG